MSSITWFLYEGDDVEPVPIDATHVRVHPSLTSIPPGAFRDRTQLQRVDLPDGVQVSYVCISYILCVHIISYIIM